MNTNANDRKEVSSMAAKTYTPKELATELGLPSDGKILRSYLRKNHSRAIEAKNTAWIIPASVANDCRKHFAKNRAGSASAK
jgi:hypothetical protein